MNCRILGALLLACSWNSSGGYRGGLDGGEEPRWSCLDGLDGEGDPGGKQGTALLHDTLPFSIRTQQPAWGRSKAQGIGGGLCAAQSGEQTPVSLTCLYGGRLAAVAPSSPSQQWAECGRPFRDCLTLALHGLHSCCRIALGVKITRIPCSLWHGWVMGARRWPYSSHHCAELSWALPCFYQTPNLPESRKCSGVP